MKVVCGRHIHVFQYLGVVLRGARCISVSPELTVDMSSSFSFDSMIHGHHIYKDIWPPRMGENLTCRTEPGNIHDPYAVAVQCHDVDSDSIVTIGHVPRCISSVCFIVCENNSPKFFPSQNSRKIITQNFLIVNS